MEFRILGPLEVIGDDGPLALGGTRQRAVLALLLVHAGQVLPVDLMVDELWAGEPPASAHTTLRGYVSHLRRALEPDRARRGRGDILVTSGPGYALHLGPDELDRDRFERSVAQARAEVAAEPGTAAARLREALSLWRGPALADFTFEPFAQPEITRLEEARLAAVELRVQADLATGARGDLVGELEALVAAHPLREQLWGHLMTALYRSGRQADALRAYQRVRAVLGEELGIEPGPALQQLEQSVLLQDAGLGGAPPAAAAPAAGSPGPPVPSRPQGNLALHLTAFVGRHRELAEVESLLATDRLVSVVGSGGSGKTRLAAEVAARQAPSWPGGAWMVELAAVTDPALVAGAVADAVGAVRDTERPVTDVLVDALRPARLLLVLDNCEQVLDGAAAVAAAVLGACPEVRMLVTSREPLGLAGERVWRIPVLATPPPGPGDDGTWWDCDAVRLFAQRAGTALPGFSVTAENAAAVVEVCQRLDGLPLAIELAAARLNVLSVEEIASRLSDRFGLLTGGDRSAAARHRTLRAAVDWSYETLPPAERTVFRRLAVFAGGFSMPAAEEVGPGADVPAAKVLDLVARLVDKSLIGRQPDAAGAGRCRMLETLREYGLARLVEAGEAGSAQGRHAHWYLELATAAGPGLRGADQGTWLRRLDAELDNLRAALGWSLRSEPGTALRLAAALWWFWVRRGHVHEGRDWLARALATSPEAPAVLRATALNGAAYLAWLQGDLAEAARLVEQAAQAAAVAGDLGAGALAAAVGARVELDQGEGARAVELGQQAGAQFTAAGDEWGAAWTTRHLASMAFRQGDLAESEALSRSARASFEALGDEWGVAGCMDLEAALAHQRGDRGGARALWEESIRRYRELGDRTALAFSLHHLESFLKEVGETEQAARLARESVGLDQELGGHMHREAWLDILDHLGEESRTNPAPGP